MICRWPADGLYTMCRWSVDDLQIICTFAVRCVKKNTSRVPIGVQYNPILCPLCCCLLCVVRSRYHIHYNGKRIIRVAFELDDLRAFAPGDSLEFSYQVCACVCVCASVCVFLFLCCNSSHTLRTDRSSTDRSCRSSGPAVNELWWRICMLQVKLR